MSETIHELVLTRLIDAPREKLFRCWTEPALLKQWFAPAPYSTPIAEVDLRVGGGNRIVMKSPEGQEIACPGTYLEIIPNHKLVFTDAYTGDWVPRTSAKPFMTAIITFEEEDGKTRYTATVRHWTKEDCETHVKMGFHQGWGQCADQLAALAKTI
ncbi:MAG: SRPBCC family protein [Rhodomicrobium sp.]